MIMKEITLNVNNNEYTLQVKPSATLLDVIREDLGLDRYQRRLR